MSFLERSISIWVINAVTDTTLAFGSPTASDGPLPVATPGVAGYGSGMTVEARNNSGGCTGSFGISGGRAAFTVSYDHPLSARATAVTASTATGYVWATDAATYSGHDTKARINLYQGVAANGFGGYAVPLRLLDAATPVNNCQDFANSMFGPNMRNTAVVEAAYGNPTTAGYVAPADFTGSQMAGSVELWTSQWIGGAESRCPEQDAAVLAFLADYVRTASPAGALTLWLPRIAYKPGTSPLVFSLSGYDAYPFLSADGEWNSATVAAFLTLLAAGAHFVTISANNDLPPGVTMRALDQAFAAAGLPSSHDPGNSHYASVTNVTGTYYLDVSSDFAPVNCGLLLALLFGRTVNSLTPVPGSYNTFMQLEGWPSMTSRHSTDYDTYKATLWNISTYGACPYSEKRGTTAFLAPPGWLPTVYRTTRMMPYVGAYATNPDDPQPQPWLNTSLVDIPDSAPALPARYFV